MNPDRITLDDCHRQRMKVVGICSCGERELTLSHERQRKFWRTPVKRLFDEERLVCASCRKPLWGVRVDEAGNLMFPGQTIGLWAK